MDKLKGIIDTEQYIRVSENKKKEIDNNKINIENQKLLVLIVFNDDVYEKIIMCLDVNNQKVFVIKNKVITDTNIINAINKKYDLEVPDELKGKIF